MAYGLCFFDDANGPGRIAVNPLLVRTVVQWAPGICTITFELR